MQKNGIQLVWRIPQYHNWILKLPKYCKKKTPILQTLVSPSWDVTIISLTSIKAQMSFLSVSHLSRPSTFSVFSVILFISPSVPSPPPPPPPPKKMEYLGKKKEYPHSIEVNCSSLQHVRHVLKSPVLVSILNIVGSQPMLVCAGLLTSGNVQKSRHLIKSDRNRACKI